MRFYSDLHITVGPFSEILLVEHQLLIERKKEDKQANYETTGHVYGTNRPKTSHLTCILSEVDLLELKGDHHRCHF